MIKNDCGLTEEMETSMNQNFVQIEGLDLMCQGEKIYLQGVTLGN